ncbi:MULTISPECIES: AAA family ATPase [Niastella]|uniref:AAA family ATPase n=1 Tax=Niastella soli TaxID=2821487 RepID=A0ABS3Z5K6_9BACT|nr:MoxR family ATPase [Niastella soli]MBO9205447.1 AAA family ATPase [Niastella soli]
MIQLHDFTLNNAWKDYIPAKGMVDAIEMAIALNKPLLVTGEPGTGKTKLADWVAGQLAFQTRKDPAPFCPTPFSFYTKSTSVAADLFYNYDAVSHFGKVQRQNISEKFSEAEQDKITREHIELKAMGLAIAQTHGLQLETLQNIRNYKGKDNNGAMENVPMSSVVLVDEVDKAPREFANDLLNEIEKYRFEIKEINKVIERAENGCRIVTILTSNDEKTLPNAFLRRCVFYHIDFPDPDRLLEIVKLKLGINAADTAYDAALMGAIARFEEVRNKVLNKKPTTSELLDWVNILYHDRTEDGKNKLVGADGKLYEKALDSKYYGVLAKTNVDLEAVSK